MGIVNRENTPHLNTRSQAHRENQIRNFRSRITEIDRELANQRQLLTLTKNREIEDISKSLSNLSFNTSERSNKLKGLESFINKTAEMFGKPVGHSPKQKLKDSGSEKTDEVTALPPNTSIPADKQPPSTENLATSTPKTIIRPTNLNPDLKNQHEPKKSDKKNQNEPKTAPNELTSTTNKAISIPAKPGIHTQKTQHKFDFPPTYESQEDKLIRLENEQALRDEFDYNMMIQDQLFQKNAGAVPKKPQRMTTSQDFSNLFASQKAQYEPKFSFTQPPRDKPIASNNNLDRPVNHGLGTQTQSRPKIFELDEVFEQPKPYSPVRKASNISREEDDNTLNEKFNRFASYKATPERMVNHFKSPQRSFDSLHVYRDPLVEMEEQQYIPQRGVRADKQPKHSATFDIPYDQYDDFVQEQYPQRTVRFTEPQRPQRHENFDYNQNQIQFPQRNVQFREQPPNYENNYSHRELNRNIPQRPRFNIPPNYGNDSHRNNLSMRSAHHEQTGEQTRSSFLRRLRLIPKFNGESFKDLKDFIDITETLYFSCINRSEEQELFEHMVLQLRGEAKSLMSRLNNFDWQTIKNNLLSHFAYLANKNVLSSQLENLHQEKNETLSEYTERARKLLREKNAVYNDLTEEQRMEHNRLARRAFSKGINDPRLRDRMITRGASSLEDAIAFAIEAENDALTDVHRSELFCRFCRFSGHRENECRRKENANSDIGKLASALRSMSSTFGRNRNNFRPNQRNFGQNNFNNSGPNNFGSNSNFNRNMNPNWSNRNWNNQNTNRNWNNNGNNYQNRNWNNNNNNNGNNFNSNNNRNGNNNGNGNSNGSNSQNNRGTWQPNQRQQQRSNNFIRRARINAITRDSSNDDFSSDNRLPSGWLSDGWSSDGWSSESDLWSSDLWSSDGWSSDDSTDHSTEN